ncbi:hypothetical protein L5515_003186 [Caenorhabditis briggsae]|uniref:Uncharacterized protein n=3 Tax=Caenorhabditis TaxID=6237 RepID=A0AAE9J9A2_CAEBR|nr:hypothetical protein CAEBREN_26416 [Caenorhabditis brenneri]EGT55047.1 hypothetical protein CAEBREN_14757 [Caenorhabditis brenneri]ULT98872.1 hypothetical protein L3Y34_000312 [Caenorhabditis briggsae]UMM21562.1 hypothetical protein L5515_003186 [Caenorhabditis briggsae]
MTGLLKRSATINEATRTRRHKFALKYDLNNNTEQKELEAQECPSGAGMSETFVWDWPFSNDGTAPGAYTPEKFLVCLPFNKGGTGEKNGTTKKFERIAESDFSWSMGLSRDAELGSTCFWRLEIEIIRNMNAIVLIASRDISRYYENTKRLKRVRKMYRLPDYYDVTTVTTTMYDWAVVVEAQKKSINRPTMRRASTFQ